ncbi:MAG: ABC transporter permease [Thaumarchaeota archaeon]|nr:ABC transporter permease [Nitrososphaerota archaeon]
MSAIRPFLRSKLALAGLVLLAASIVIAVYGATLNADKIIYSTNPSLRAEPPSSIRIFGTDAYGRNMVDIISLALGTDLYVGIVAAVLSATIGILVGAFSAIFRGILDEVLSRLTDVFISIPSLVLALAISAALGRSYIDIIIALVIADWPQIARLVRSETLSELNKPYVEALLVLGVKKPRIIFRHVLKNISFFLASIVALHVAFIITFLSALEYIGFSVGSLSPELGAILAQGQTFIFNDPWIVIIPSAFLVIVILTFTLLSNGLRHLDPRSS